MTSQGGVKGESEWYQGDLTGFSKKFFYSISCCIHYTYFFSYFLLTKKVSSVLNPAEKKQENFDRKNMMHKEREENVVEKRPVGRPRKAARVKIGTTLPPDLMEELKALIDERGMTLAAAIEFAVRQYIEDSRKG